MVEDFAGRGSSDPHDASFWFITKSMGYPEGTIAGGYGVPFEDAELVLIKHYYRRIKEIIPGRKAVGATMIGLGTAMLIPGPIDGIFYVGGQLLFKHPAGGAAGVAFYNALAIATIGVGTVMMMDF